MRAEWIAWPLSRYALELGGQFGGHEGDAKEAEPASNVLGAVDLIIEV